MQPPRPRAVLLTKAQFGKGSSNLTLIVIVNGERNEIDQEFQLFVRVGSIKREYSLILVSQET